MFSPLPSFFSNPHTTLNIENNTEIINFNIDDILEVNRVCLSFRNEENNIWERNFFDLPLVTNMLRRNSTPTKAILSRYLQVLCYVNPFLFLEHASLKMFK